MRQDSANLLEINYGKQRRMRWIKEEREALSFFLVVVCSASLTSNFHEFWPISRTTIPQHGTAWYQTWCHEQRPGAPSPWQTPLVIRYTRNVVWRYVPPCPRNNRLVAWICLLLSYSPGSKWPGMVTCSLSVPDAELQTTRCGYLSPLLLSCSPGLEQPGSLSLTAWRLSLMLPRQSKRADALLPDTSWSRPLVVIEVVSKWSGSRSS